MDGQNRSWLAPEPDELDWNIPGLCVSGLNEPSPISYLVELQLGSDLWGGHCIGQILLVRHDEQHCVT